MLMSMADIAQKHGPIRRVVHVGGHQGQEIPSYLLAGAKQIDVFEPLDFNLAVLRERWDHEPRVTIHPVALGNRVGEVDIFVASNEGQSSSVLVPKDHLTQYPHITFQTSKTVPLARLDDFRLSQVDFLAMDVQGYELEVLRGAAKTLEKTELVYCEVNQAELYEGCAQVEQIDEFLAGYGLERVATDWVGRTWGDALYVKRTLGIG